MSKLNRLGKRGPPLSINADLMALADSLNHEELPKLEVRELYTNQTLNPSAAAPCALLPTVKR